jgi:hypothetical protein
MANSTLKTVGVIAGIYALWYIWRENKNSRAMATATSPAETPQQILKKLVTTNPLAQAPLLIDDIKVGAKALYTPVKGFVTTVVNTAFQQPIGSSNATSTQLVSAPINTSASNFTGLVGLDGNGINSKNVSMGFNENPKAYDGIVPPTTGINQYCKCSRDMVKPQTEMSIFNR